jgi:hypothetical protein
MVRVMRGMVDMMTVMGSRRLGAERQNESGQQDEGRK